MGERDRPATGFRDLFYRNHDSKRSTYRIVLAEEAQPLEEGAGYSDLLSFESDIAQVVGLILLFVESPGSLAELGAFAALQTVAPNLLAVLTDHHYSEKSFVMNGPIRFLERSHGEESVLSLDSIDINFIDGDHAIVDAENFQRTVEDAILHRLDQKAKWSKFDRTNQGHIILLVTGLCQEYGALIEKEIRDLLDDFGIEDFRFNSILYCAELLGWVKKVRKGHHIFFVAVENDPALNFKFSNHVDSKDKSRWRANIRLHWKTSDPSRIRAIYDVNGGGN